MLNISKDVFVLIPAYNEAATIRQLAEQCLELVPNVIVVDDGSQDQTAAQLMGLPIILLRNAKNEGKAACLWRGFEYALKQGAQFVVTLDGDGQHNPADIWRLLNTAIRFPDHIVVGARLHDKKNFPPRRYYANQFARFWISWASGYPIADTQSGFRVYPASLLSQLSQREVCWNGFVFESEVLIVASSLGARSVAVSIPGIYPQQARASHFRPVRDIARIVLMVAGQLLRRGLYPMGLWRSLSLPMAVVVAAETLQAATLNLSQAASDNHAALPRIAGD
ncbi:MAG: glycosyltransferase family 2 protein [Betaproteobacteria bacterium]|nr:glycosyltransferase family 2 protein [Betaproteobacteria bacterium]